jgi:hypothetical protein
MSGLRTLLAAAGALAVAAAHAAPTCPPKVDLRTCIGEAASATIRFCFLPQAGCAGTGVVRAVRPPATPFTLEGMRVQSALGTRPVGGGDLPLVLLPGQSLLIDVGVTMAAAGDHRTDVELIVARRLDDGGGDDDGGKIEGDACDVDLRVRTPGCLPAGAGAACADAVCVDGVCREQPPAGSCDDGDPCTVEDRCDDGRCTGRPLDCDDGLACTRDECRADGCAHVPVDARCDRGDCSVASCRPDVPAADADGCVETPVGEGEPCTDDGVPCTEDVCTAASCLHVPLDTRCPGAAACGSVACLPGAEGSDATGCLAAPAADDGVCAEDGDPCSDDRCRAGACRHERVPQHETCVPVEDAFRRALALLALTRSLAVSTEAVGRAQPTAIRGERLTAPLLRLQQELERAVAALAGRVPVTVGAAAAGVPETPAQARARAALLVVGRMPLEARSYLRALSAARRQGLEAAHVQALGQQGRALRRGVKRLKVELKRLRRTKVQFAK